MKALAEQIVDIDGVEIYGRVVGVRGLMVEVAGPIHAMSVGARLTIETTVGRPIPCEVVGFADGHALAMPFAALEGVRRGCRAVVASAAGAVRPSERWLGRVINAMGEPIDGQGPLPLGPGTLHLPQFAAAGACPHAGRRAARSRRARAQHLPHCLPRPAHGHLLRLGRRQVGAAVDAGPQRVAPTYRSSVWSANAAARCRSSCRTIWVRPAWRVRWWWYPPPTSRR